MTSRFFNNIYSVLGLVLFVSIISGCAADSINLNRQNNNTVRLATDAQKIKGGPAKNNDQLTSKEIELTTNLYLSGRSEQTQDKTTNASTFSIK